MDEKRDASARAQAMSAARQMHLQATTRAIVCFKHGGELDASSASDGMVQSLGADARVE